MALLVFASIFLLAGRTLASETNGTIDAVYKYAWGENIGWINFGCDECDVAITDDGLTGHAWSTQYGWVNLSPNNAGNTGVINDGEGTLSGFAWSSNLGWIDFTGVTINTSGEFLGYATLDSDASQINFNCVNGASCASADFKVKTDWRPASSRATAGGGGITSGSRPNLLLSPILSPVTLPITTIPPVGLTANIFDAISAFISGLFKPVPSALVEIPETAPLPLGARWDLLPVRAINRFVFAPLPYEIRILAGKFPELNRTFQEVGIERFTDVNKLAGVDLNIPGLTDILNTTLKNLGPTELAELQKIPGVSLSLPGFSTIGELSGGLGSGKIALIEGLPIANFSLTAKRNLPGEFVFARGAGELVDLNVAMSVSETGQVTQRMSALPGKTLKLVVKPLGPARSVTGYIVFLTPTPRITENSILRSSLTASALFSLNGLVETIEGPVPARNASSIADAGGEKKLVLSSFEYTDSDRDGIYTADVTTPVVPGEYEIITIIDYVDPVLGSRKMSLVAVIDPEGYIYEENNGKETRIPNAIISLYKLNLTTKEYELWQAGDYQQENPQITDVRGTYSFLVPSGTYYFQVVAPGYRTFEGKAFTVVEGRGVHQNIELKPTGVRLAGIDWQTVLLIVVLLLLVYNLYRNKHGTA